MRYAGLRLLVYSVLTGHVPEIAKPESISACKNVSQPVRRFLQLNSFRLSKSVKNSDNEPGWTNVETFLNAAVIPLGRIVPPEFCHHVYEV